MKKSFSIILVFCIFLSILSFDASANTDASVNMYVNGRVDRTLELINGIVDFYVPSADSGKYFSGWFTDPECATRADTLKTLPTGTDKLYAGFNNYASAFTADFTGLQNTSTVYLPTFYSETSEPYSAVSQRMGWSCRGIEQGRLDFYATAPWSQGGAYILGDGNGNAFVAESNTTYDITVEYDVPDIVTADEVGIMPDGSTYSGGKVNFNVGIGMYMNSRASLSDKNFNVKSETRTFTETVFDRTETFTLTTGDLSGTLPVLGVYSSISGVPPRFNGTTKIAEQPGNLTYGYNKLSIKSVTVFKHIEIVLKDKNETVIKTVSAPCNKPVDFGSVFENAEFIGDDGRGYGIESAELFYDSKLTRKVDTNNFVPSDDTALYGDFIPSVTYNNNQISFYGFEDKYDIYNNFSGFSYDENGGFESKYCIKSENHCGPVNIAPNAVLQDGATYMLSFNYKTDKNITVSVSGTEYLLSASGKWAIFTAFATPYNGELLFSVVSDEGASYFDNFTVYAAISFDGIAVLSDKAEDLSGSQAMRFFYSYNLNDELLKMADEDYDVTARGIILAPENVPETELNVNSEKAVISEKRKDFNKCWSFDGEKLVYSVYLSGFHINDARNINVRGFVELNGNTVFYSPVTTVSVAEIKEKSSLKNSSYSFSDSDFLEKTVINARYSKTTDGITFNNSGNAFRITAKTGEKLTLRFSASTDKTRELRFRLYIDGKRSDRFERVTVKCGTAEYSVSFALPNDAEIHEIEIMRETDRGVAAVLLGVDLDGNLLDSAPKDVLIEYVGDGSITGDGCLSSYSDKPNDKNSFASMGFAAVSAHYLDADFRIISEKSAGFSYGASGQADDTHSLINYYKYNDLSYDSTPADQTARKADVVCVYLGRNDNFAFLSGFVKTDKATFYKNKVSELTNEIRKVNPGANIVYISGLSDNDISPLIENGVAAAGGEQNGIYALRFSVLNNSTYTGSSGYTVYYTKQKTLSAELSRFLKAKGLVREKYVSDAPEYRSDGRKLVWDIEFDDMTTDDVFCELTNDAWYMTSDTELLDISGDKRTTKIENGELVMSIAPDLDGTYTTHACLSTLNRMSYRYGYLELRANIPFREHVVPAFWTVPDQKLRKSKCNVEVDIFEVFNPDRFVHTSIIKWTDNYKVMDIQNKNGSYEGNRDYQISVKDGEDINDTYHIFGLEWTPERLKFYVDGYCYYSVSIKNEDDYDPNFGDAMECFRDYQIVVIDNWLNTSTAFNNCLGNMTVDYRADYIRLYQYENSEEDLIIY